MQELLERGGFEQLAAFVAVAECGSFAEAATKRSASRTPFPLVAQGERPGHPGKRLVAAPMR